MSNTQPTEHKRIFLAVWPDEATRQQLSEVQKKLKRDPELQSVLQSARLVTPDNLHMTLHFIGSISPDVLQALEACLGSVQCRSFDMTVSAVGCFPRPRVFWLGLKDIPPVLSELEQQTLACVQQCIEGYRHIPYRPHITLFRKAKTSLQLDMLPEINWRVKSFALVESKTHPEGVQYHVLKEWLLLPQ